VKLTIGTFNLNNLFSRYNFKGEITAIRKNDTGVHAEILYQFTANDRFKIRTYRGRLVEAKKAAESQKLADRIMARMIDVLAVQEVEDIDTLRHFNRVNLKGLYPYAVLVEGNDPRLIDIGVLSQLPVGGITSWQEAVHPDSPEEKIFGRDLLDVQILNSTRSGVLFTLFNNHLKSHYVDYRDDPVAGEEANSIRRRRQSEIVAKIVKARTRPGSKFVILGDMNDPPDSPDLAPFVQDAELNLTNALANPTETRPAKADTPPPPGPAWTHRYKPRGKPARYELLDQIWLSASLANKQTGAWIDRRTKHGGDGSDHDPAWIEVEL
jgi:endonuclease/exonuclease/phosphatase family metal-dependent hydrolase